MIFHLLLCLGIPLAFILPLGRLENFEKTNLLGYKSIARLKSEDNSQNLTDKVYGLVNVFTEASTAEHKGRLISTRPINKNSAALFQKTTTSLRRESQIQLLQNSVADKSKSASMSRGQKTEFYYSTTMAPQGLDNNSGAILQLSLKDKEYTLSLGQSIPYDRHSRLLTGKSSSVSVSSIILPTRLEFYSIKPSSYLNLKGEARTTPQLMARNDGYLTSKYSKLKTFNQRKLETLAKAGTREVFSNGKPFVDITAASSVDKTVRRSLNNTDNSMPNMHSPNSELNIVPKSILTTNENPLAAGLETLSHRLEGVKPSGKRALERGLNTSVGLVGGTMATVNPSGSSSLMQARMKISLNLDLVSAVQETRSRNTPTLVRELPSSADLLRWSANSIHTVRVMQSEQTQSPEYKLRSLHAPFHGVSAPILETSYERLTGMTERTESYFQSALQFSKVFKSKALPLSMILSTSVPSSTSSSTSAIIQTMLESSRNRQSKKQLTRAKSPKGEHVSTSKRIIIPITSRHLPPSSETKNRDNSVSSTRPLGVHPTPVIPVRVFPSSSLYSSARGSSKENIEFLSSLATSSMATPSLRSVQLRQEFLISSSSPPPKSLRSSKLVLKEKSLSLTTTKTLTSELDKGISSSSPSSSKSLRSKLVLKEKSLSSTTTKTLISEPDKGISSSSIASLRSSILSHKSSFERPEVLSSQLSRGFSQSAFLLSATATHSLRAAASFFEFSSSEIKAEASRRLSSFTSTTSLDTAAETKPSLRSSLSSLSSEKLSNPLQYPWSLSLSPSLASVFNYHNASILAATKSHSLRPTMRTATPTPSLSSPPLSRQLPESTSPIKHVLNVTAFPFDSGVTTLQSTLQRNINDNTVQSSRFIFSSVSSVKSEGKALLLQKTPVVVLNCQRNSLLLSTHSNRPSVSYGIFIKDTTRKPPSKPLDSQTETSSTISMNTPFLKPSQTLSIVTRISDIPYNNNAKSDEETVSSSVERQSTYFTLDYSKKENFSKRSDVRIVSFKTLKTVVSKTKKLNTMLGIDPSSTMEGSRRSGPETHGIHNKKFLSSLKETIRTQTTRKTNQASNALSSNSSPDVKMSTLTSDILLQSRQSLNKKGNFDSARLSQFFARSAVNLYSSSLDSKRRLLTQELPPLISTMGTFSLTRTSAAVEFSTGTSDEFSEVTKPVSSSKEMPSTTRGYPQDSTAQADVVVSKSLFIPEPNKLKSKMAFSSISPSLSTYRLPASSSIMDGNLSVTTTQDNASPGIKNSGSNNKILLFIIIATIPTVLLLILIAIVLFRRVKEREAEPFYKIQVEYNDDNKQRRARCANSRLDLTIKGMHIDLEFPSPGEKRRSTRLSAPPNLSDEHMRELQKLSQECKENLEWINEVLERELDTPVFSGSNSSDNDRIDAACTNHRDSMYSGCSEKEKENYEMSEKIIKRESPKHAIFQSDKNDRELCLANDSDGKRDSVISVNDSDELKIKLDQQPSPSAPAKPKKPDIPPKPKIRLTKTDRIGTVTNPLSSTIVIECTACDDERREINKFDSLDSGINIPRERKLLRKPPVPENKGRAAHNPENNTLTASEFSLRTGNAAKDSPCVCNILKKPPIPKKPEGLVINRFKRKPNNEEAKGTTYLHRSGRKLDVCCAPRKGCEAV